MDNGTGIRHGKAGIVFFFLLACAAFALWAPNAGAQSSFYVDRGCSGCHGTTPTTCNGCHHHGPSGLGVATVPAGKTTATPGETITIRFSGGSQSGWIRAILYRDNVEIARSTGTGSPPRGGSGFPITFTTTAPTPSGASQTYTYAVAWFGNSNDSGSVHGEVRATTTIPITVTAATAAGALSVSPAGGLTSSGTAGGPFTPSSLSYTLRTRAPPR